MTLLIVNGLDDGVEMVQQGNFFTDILNNIKDLDPEFSKVVDENFWGLFSKKMPLKFFNGKIVFQGRNGPTYSNFTEIKKGPLYYKEK